MHPMFVRLFIETDADELDYEEERRRRTRRVQKARSRLVMQTQAGSHDRQPAS